MTSQTVYFRSNKSQVSEHASLEQQIIAAIRTVYDPEIPVNIYDLGLVYKIDINSSNEVLISMTLTAPGCPVAGLLLTQVQTAVADIDQVKAVKVELVWDPPWTQDRMSDEARLELGMF